MRRFPLTLVLGIVLALLLAGCARGVVDAGPIATDDPDPDAITEPTEPTEPTDATTDPEPATDPEPDQTPTSEPTSPPAEPAPNETAKDETTRAVRLYFVAPGGGTPGRADPFLVSVQREIPATQGIARATLRELIDGPSAADRALIRDISSAVPADTLVLGVHIEDGLARVDLSREFEAGGGSLSMFLRLAQVVYTATQFPTVDEVQFMLDGRPVTVFSGEGIEIDGPASRADLVDLLPTIFVDTPAAGAAVAAPLRVTGMATVFEATFQYRLEAANGTVLAEGFAMTNRGQGWGSFDFTIDYKVSQRQQGTLRVWVYSAEDGSVQAERVTPLTLLP
jgi:germination protein M